MKDFFWPIAILLGIISIALFGGVKNTQQNASFITNQNGNTIPTVAERQLSTDEIASDVQNSQYQANQLQQKVVDLSASPYKNKITMSWGSYDTTDSNQEYIEIDANYNNTVPIKISDWQLMSTSSQQRVTIPQSTTLYFSNSNNSIEDVWLSPGERAYIITGRSPLSYGFHTNICTGYLANTNNFNPGLYTSCPAPRDENLSSIPRTPNNNNCFDLIDSLGSCQNGPVLNNTYSYECQQFIETKLNYQSCVDTHKSDSNFYSPKTWYIYLKRDNTLWLPRRETVILYDNSGKVVSKISR